MKYTADTVKYIVAEFRYTPIKADGSRDVYSIEEIGKFPYYVDAEIFAEELNNCRDTKISNNNSLGWLYQYKVITTREAAAYKKEVQS